MCPWLCWWGLGGGGGGLAVRVGWVQARLVENPGWLLRRSSFVVVVVGGCCMFCFGYFVVGVGASEGECCGVVGARCFEVVDAWSCGCGWGLGVVACGWGFFCFLIGVCF